MSRATQLGLAVLGAVISVGVSQYVRNVDRSVAATPAATFSVRANDGGGTRTGQDGGDNSEVVTEPRIAIPSRDVRFGAVSPRSNDVATEQALDAPETETTTVFGFQLPAWVDTVLGRRSSVPSGAEVASTVVPVSPPVPAARTTRTPAASTGCNHDVVPNPQGITAELEYVGVLLNGQQRADDRFSGAELDDLKILIQWRSLFQNHAQRIDLIAPDGSLYQSLSRLVTADDTAAVETRVPVNGSWITRYGLYGSWCVEVFVDQESAPVTSSRLVIARPQ